MRKNSKKAAPPKQPRARRASPAAQPPPPEKPTDGKLCPVVGFGASAGGLEAFSDVLLNLPGDTGMAFVLIQHLDPKHSSLLTELLAKSTAMAVLEAKEGTRVEPDTVYVIPPNAGMTISRGILHLEPRPAHHMPIDNFFRSLALDEGSKAIGVILSGTASDGTLGLKAIKVEGGITFAQDEKTAKYDGMPRSAILAGCVDFILPPEDIARELVRLCKHPYVTPPDEAQTPPTEDEHRFSQIFTLLRNTTGVDFVYYKRATVSRRILRRMALHKLESVEQYLDFLRHTPDELNALFHDILINVTSFFREPSTFDALREKVFPLLFKDRVREDSVRIWVPGCSTGEEAYSVAIALLEYMRENDLDHAIQIFGTDLSDNALEKARMGVYSDSISADVSAERLRRFFVKVNGSYQISRSIRDLCVFARQNLTKDPPFSKLDLISCRNVLIYLGPVLQTRVLRYFHYGLKPDCFLVLGISETIGSATELFAPLGGKEKMYTKRIVPAGMHVDIGPFEEARGGAEYHRPEDWTAGPELQRRVDQVILARHSPPGVVVDKDLKILQFRGDTAPYLAHPAGQPSLSLLRMTRSAIGIELRKLIQRVRKTGAMVTSNFMRLSPAEDAEPVRLAITPIKGSRVSEMAFLILFETEREGRSPHRGQAPAPKSKDKRGGASRSQELEQELNATKQYLQTIIEEQEAASEELKSANEEVQSSNEELQSTNEELLTSKEELQSANEELNTVNEEMQGRNTELTQINDDLNNLLSSVNIPIVMLDNELRIRRFTPQAKKLLDLLPTDVGRKVTDFRLKINIPDLESLFIDVIDNLHTKEREVHDQEGSTYLMSIRPYRTTENRIDGAMMTLYDVTERQGAAEIRYRRLFEAAKDGIIIIDAETFEILDVNPFAAKLFGADRMELVGRRIYDAGILPESQLSGLLEAAETEPVLKVVQVQSHNGETLDLEVIANAYPEGERHVIQLNLRDVSPRIRAEEKFRRDEEQRRQAEKMEAVGRLAGGVAHDFNNLLTAIVGYSDLLRERVGDDNSMVRDIDVIRKAAERATRLTRQLLAFGRKQILQPVALDLNALLNEMDQMLKVMVSERVAVKLELDPSLGRIRADRTQMEQVVTNLVLNARDAMPEGGTITVSTSNIHVDESYSRTHRSVPPGDYVMLSVSDPGTGMDPETQSHLFEPFFTSKPKGQGTGLGLSTIYGIVKQSGGHIWAYSALNQGTTFEIYFPLVEEKASAQKNGDQPARSLNGSETILLVEDEMIVRRLAQLILSERGYHVIAASDGPEALQLQRDTKDRIHLLLTDVIMPRMSGREVADRVAESRPDTRILFMSGHADDAIVHHGVLDAGVAFLQKPFTPESLARKVREVLDRN